MATTAERLAEVEVAISAIITGGQLVRYADRQVTLADLGELRRLETYLRNQLAAQKRAASKRGRISYAVPE